MIDANERETCTEEILQGPLPFLMGPRNEWHITHEVWKQNHSPNAVTTTLTGADVLSTTLCQLPLCSGTQTAAWQK